MTTISRLSVSLTADPKGFRKGLKGAQSQLGMFKKDVAQIGIGVAAIGGAGVGLLLNDIIDVNAQFQTMKSTLTTLTGSKAAGSAAFDMIEKFARETPFNLEQAVEGFSKLKALGLDPSTRALESYGNTASAMGKSMTQMVEAVADATTGEFERLKEFGIKAKSEKDKVTFTFQGVATTVKKSAAEIEGYLLGIGENQFGGAMRDQMGNLTPAFSNLEASVKNLQVAIGEAGLNDLIVEATNSMTAFVDSIDAAKVVAAVTTIKEVFQDINDFIDPITDWLAQEGSEIGLRNIAEGGIVQEGFTDMLSAGAREAFDKAISEGRLYGDTRASAADADTFADFAKRLHGQELLDETKITNENLRKILVKQTGAVAQ
jgi:hypothetical protein